ncbi:MAG: ATP synthase F1 subunit delta [Chitinophagales bacterium]
MSAISVASRYANALLEEAKKSNLLDRIYQDMQLFEQTTNESRELRSLLKSPIISVDRKLSSLKAIFSGKISDLTMNFLHMLVNKRRESYFKEIIEAFYQAYNDLNNIKMVELISATTLNEGLESKIVNTVKTQLGATNLQVKKTVDPKILGGFIIKIGDKVFDTSLQNKLNTLRREILAN